MGHVPRRPTVLLVLALMGCGGEPSVDPLDAARLDAGPMPRDANVHDTFMVPPDAWIAPDAGPPVLPQQSWTVQVAGPDGPAAVSLTIEPRAEGGIARVSAGAEGHGSAIVFDVDGGRLVGRTPLEFGAPEGDGCGTVLVRLETPELRFEDHDGDGIHETLVSLAALGAVTRITPDGSVGNYQSANLTTSSVASDTTAPTFALTADPEFVAGEPIVLTASEPIEPAFAVTLVGPTSHALTGEIGVSSGARWWLDTWDLPVGHYDMVVGGSTRDLAGLDAPAVPSLSFDVVAPPLVHPTLLFDSRVAGFQSAAMLAILPADALHGESIFSPTRLVVAVDMPAGGWAFDFNARIESTTPDANPQAMVTVHGPDGTITLPRNGGCGSIGPSSVPGFVSECDFTGMLLPFQARTSGRYYFSFNPDGTSCDGTPRNDGSGIALEALRIYMH